MLAPEETHHLGIGNLIELLIPRPDGAEGDRLKGTDDEVGVLCDATHRLPCSHRGGGDDPAGAGGSEEPQRRLDRRPGGDPIVDDDHRAVPRRRRASSPPKSFRFVIDICELPGPFLLDVPRRDAQRCDDGLIENERPILGNCADGELRVAGCTQLVRDENVELPSEPFRNLGRNRHSAARHPEDERHLTWREHHALVDRLGELSPGIHTVPVHHGASVLSAVSLEVMRRGLLIANPSASGFTGAAFRRVLEILGRDFDIEVAWPHDPADTRVRARDAAVSGCDVVFAMGGDGVAHHVANGLALTSTALGIIPAGTTNVLARILGLPSKGPKAAELMGGLPAVATRMAYIAAEGPGGSRSEYATFAVGVGFDAAVVERAEQRPHSKTTMGGLHYAATAVARLVADWRGRPANLRIECNGERKDAVALLAQVHRPYTYFGTVPLDLSDRPSVGIVAGAVDDLEVHRATEILARAVLRRRFPERLGVKVWHDVQKLIVEADPPAPYQADGELLGRATAIEIVPAENALLVLRDPAALQD